eukprot:CAMPEP_0171453978 /NCGR_PEP_ID=MMETSP0945-20130129/1457_1 /TAXON_ID=109269 /ORGANISM="Vaucheria litorea, Strain CCMP2940" /LENGTH=272 /DNA_ID=CAMNT_0011978927 /DNA_START=90 /DNA_END=905 /DNA_ORIENTATION=+
MAPQPRSRGTIEAPEKSLTEKFTKDVESSKDGVQNSSLIQSRAQNQYGSGFGTNHSPMYSSSLGSSYGYDSGGYGSYGGLGTGSMYGGGGMYGIGNSMYGNSYYGGRMGGMYGGGMGHFQQPNSWMYSIQNFTSSLGQITELMGMNTQVLGFFFTTLVGFLEMASSAIASLQPYQEFPPGHPRHGEQPPTPEEERRRQSKVKVIRWLTSLLISYAGFKIVSVFKGRNGVKKLYGQTFQNQLGGNSDSFEKSGFLMPKETKIAKNSSDLTESW